MATTYRLYSGGFGFFIVGSGYSGVNAMAVIADMTSYFSTLLGTTEGMIGLAAAVALVLIIVYMVFMRKPPAASVTQTLNKASEEALKQRLEAARDQPSETPSEGMGKDTQAAEMGIAEDNVQSASGYNLRRLRARAARAGRP